MKKILFSKIFFLSCSFLYCQGFDVKKDGSSVTAFNGYKLSYVQYKLDADTKEIYDRIDNNRIKVLISFNIDWDCITCVLNYIGTGSISVFEGNYRTDYKISTGYYSRNGDVESYKFYYNNKEVGTILGTKGSAVSIVLNNHEGRYFKYYTGITNFAQ